MSTKDDGMTLDELFFFFPINTMNFANFILNCINDNMFEEQFGKAQAGVLLILSSCGPLPISHLGERLLIAKPNMTFVIDKLEEKLLVERNSSETDRRVINISLTQKGKEYIKDLSSKLNNVLNEKLSILSTEERKEFQNALLFLTNAGIKIMNHFNI